jgi:hypothetical protein
MKAVKPDSLPLSPYKALQVLVRVSEESVIVPTGPVIITGGNIAWTTWTDVCLSLPITRQARQEAGQLRRNKCTNPLEEMAAM